MARKKVTLKDFEPLFDVVEKYTGKKHPDPRYKIDNIALQNYYPFKKEVISFLVDLLSEDMTAIMDTPTLQKKNELKKYLSKIADFKGANIVELTTVSKANKDSIQKLREYLRDIAFDLNESKKGALLFNIIFGLATNLYLLILAAEKEQSNALKPFFSHCETAMA